MMRTDESSEGSDSDLFVEGPRKESLLAQQDEASSWDSPLRGSADVLPKLQDSSWIGASVSPIPYEKEGDDSENDEVPNAQRYPSYGATESLSTRSSPKPQQPIHHPFIHTPSASSLRTPISSLPHHYRTTPFERIQESNLRQRWRLTPWFSKLILVATSTHMTAMILHDAYLWYVAKRRGIDYAELGWSLPWIRPSLRTFGRSGAFAPSQIAEYGQWYRIFTSAFATSSLIEWGLVVMAWSWIFSRDTVPSNRNGPWTYAFFYFLSIVVGQLWMSAFDIHGMAGCASWGTAGVGCAMGMEQPTKRLEFFLLSIGLVLLDLFQATNSVWGAMGGSFFGWAAYCAGMTPTFQCSTQKKPRKGDQQRGPIWSRVLAGVVVVLLWVIPIATMALD